MSRQSTLDTFFQIKQRSKFTQNMTDLKKSTGKIKTTKKINLSLTKSVTPTKSPRIIDKPVVDLSSDDEAFCTPLRTLPMNESALDFNESQNNGSSDSSQGTIPYTLTPESAPAPTTPAPTTPAPTTPAPTTPALTTPIKTPKSRLSSSSPGSRTKFYSPNKKRLVKKRTPVKRKLDAEFTTTASVKENDDYAKDDKTKALLNIITRCLQKESLKKLLPEESQMLLQRCLSVLKPGMRVVCRLYWRKAGWYKVDQVKAILKEDSDVDDPTFQMMLDSLIVSGLIFSSVDTSEGNLTFDELAAILKADELKQICKDLKLKMQSKQDSISALKNYCRKSSIGNYFTGSSQSNKSRVLKIMMLKAGPCYKLSNFARKTLDKLYVLMYLGMNYTIIREKRLEMTILYDKVGTETYPVDNNIELDDASIVFEDREQFDRYFTAHSIYEDFLEKTDLDEKCQIISKVFNMCKDISEKEMLCYKALPPWLRRFTPPHMFIKILEEGVIDLKKRKTKEDNSLAVEILSSLINQVCFRQHKKADWYSEKALILYNLGQFDEAAKVVLEGLNSDLSADSKDVLRPRIKKISSKAGDFFRQQLSPHADKETTLEKNLPAYHIYKQPMDRSSNRGKVKFETRLESARVVQDAELFCIQHYIETGEFTHGGHWEGSIATTIFFLLLWDIIYKRPKGAPGVFLSHYQRFPLDLFSESFLNNRQPELDERLAFLEMGTTGEMLDMMSKTWNSREPGELSGITRSIGWEGVRAVSSALGPSGVAALSRRLAQDYRRHHSGFPDLTLWNENTGRVKFVEVKTDTDKPSMKQIQWMHYLRQNGIETEFCYVGINTTRNKARAS